MTKTVLVLCLIWGCSVNGAPSERKVDNASEILWQDILGLDSLMGSHVNQVSRRNEGDEGATFMPTKISPKLSTPPTPPAPKSVTVSTATPPTPQSPGVVTMTSGPSHERKYFKKIEKLLFAILIVVTAIFILVASKFLLKAVLKLTSEKKPKYKTLNDKKEKLKGQWKAGYKDLGCSAP